MTRFKGKYRVESTRLPGWDYAGAGWYFVTICTRNHECLFGDIVDGEMRLSSIGEIVAEEWQKTPDIRPNVVLDEWVIMPNHLHGIIVILESPDRSVVGASRRPVETSRRPVETSRRDVSTTTSPPPRLQAGSLGAIVGQIKSVCTKRIRAAGHTEFGWQSRFYDHIIRDEGALQRIREYIANNPATWADDRINPANPPAAVEKRRRRKGAS
jgi:REP element-mobilizing transposase RayT